MLRDRPCARGLPGENGTLCPRFRHDPRTVAGRAALRVALSPGCWRRAGMAGSMSGIDWTGARNLAEGEAQGIPWPQIARGLAWFERGALKGDARRNKKDDPKES